MKKKLICPPAAPSAVGGDVEVEAEAAGTADALFAAGRENLSPKMDDPGWGAAGWPGRGGRVIPEAESILAERWWTRPRRDRRPDVATGSTGVLGVDVEAGPG